MERQHRVILLSGIISAVIGLAAGFIGGRLAPHPTLSLSPGSPSLGASCGPRPSNWWTRPGMAQAWGMGADENGATRLASSARTPPCPW